MSLAALLSLTLMGAAQTAAYQATPPSPVSAALQSQPPLKAEAPVLKVYFDPNLKIAEAEPVKPMTLMPGQLHPFGPAPRSSEFTGPFACADKKCKTRTPVYNSQTVDQREPDGRDHYSSAPHSF